MDHDTVRPSLIGARVPKVDNDLLVSGGGTFVDDLHLPDMVEATILRSPVASGRLVAADQTEARSDCRCHLVIHALDSDVLETHVPCVWIAAGQQQVSYPVISRDVRYVGQPVGVVVGPTRAVAEDLAELVDLEFESNPIVPDTLSALRPGSPLVNDAVIGNVCVELERGDSSSMIHPLLEASDVVVRRTFRIQRVAGNPIETRGIVASWDRTTERLTVWASTQSVHHAREHLASVLNLRFDQIHVIAPNVGGAFGTKEHLYPDEVLVCVASMRLGRPVKWIEDRYEHFAGSLHARDQTHDAVIGVNRDGTFVALWSDIVHDLGAHPSNVGSGPAQATSIVLQGPYHFEAAGTHVRSVLSNRTPPGAYRGFGMQQAAWVRERLVDEAARELGMDPVELRHQNMIGADELPHVTRFFQNYDSGDYRAALSRAREMAEQRPEPPQDARRRGVGYTCHVEYTAWGPPMSSR